MLAVLVVTCPCALSLATPVAIAASTARLTRLGVLVTRADAIERLARADTVVFDKTGTLTAGGASVTTVELLADLPRERVLGIAAALERQSAHPLAAAFRPFEIAGLEAQALREVEGLGLEGTIDGVRWRLGRRISPARRASLATMRACFSAATRAWSRACASVRRCAPRRLRPSTRCARSTCA
jgi:Cu2+-exporting ATPase